MSRIKLIIPAGKATASPPVGPTLGQHGINSMDFCKQFNNRTANYKPNIPLAVRIHKGSSKGSDFTFTVKHPSSMYLIKHAAEETGFVTLKQIYHIAAIDTTPSKSACKMLVGTAKSMGLIVVRD